MCVVHYYISRTFVLDDTVPPNVFNNPLFQPFMPNRSVIVLNAKSLQRLSVKYVWSWHCPFPSTTAACRRYCPVHHQSEYFLIWTAIWWSGISFGYAAEQGIINWITLPFRLMLSRMFRSRNAQSSPSMSPIKYLD